MTEHRENDDREAPGEQRQQGVSPSSEQRGPRESEPVSMATTTTVCPPIERHRSASQVSDDSGESLHNRHWGSQHDNDSRESVTAREVGVSMTTAWGSH
jgi:hypothetical protein